MKKTNKNQTDKIQKAKQAQMPSKGKQRVQAKQSPVYQTIHVFSHKYQFSATLESKLELDYFNWRQFEFDFPAFSIQPPPLFYKDLKGKLRRYTADASYIDENGQQYVDEVKYQRDADKPDIKIKHALIAQAYLAQGIYFNVLTEKTIHQGCRADNLKQLHACWAFPAPSEDFQCLLNYINYKEAPITQWITSAVSHGYSPCIIKRALAHKLLHCDITKPWKKLFLSLPL